MAIALVIIIAVIMIIAILWTQGIDTAKKNYPEYKGKDIFNEEDEN